MKSRIWSYLNYLIFLGGGIFLIYWQLSSMTTQEALQFRNAIRNTNYWYVIPIVIMSLSSHISRSMRWKIMMEPMEFKPSLTNTFGSTMIGYMANAAVPRLGEIIKCTLLAKYEKLRVDKLIGSIIVERAFDLVCYLVFILITFLIQVDIIGTTLTSKIQKTEDIGIHFIAKSILILIGVIIVLYLFRFLLKKYPQNKWFGKLSQFFSGIMDGLRSIRQIKKRGAFFLHTLFIWSMYLGQIYIGFNGIAETSGLTIQAACSVLTLASLSMILTPGGIGSFPVFVMQTLLLYHISSATGLAFGWVMWGVSTGITLLTGCLFLLLLPFLNRRSASTNSVE